MLKCKKFNRFINHFYENIVKRASNAKIKKKQAKYFQFIQTTKKDSISLFV